MRSTNAQAVPDPNRRHQRPACPAQPREWASWQIAQKYFLNPTFGGALIPDRRNVFDTTLDLSGIAFLTVPRNLSPVVSRLRFEAINNLRVEWDMDYDPKAGRLDADNVFAGYSLGRTTVGLGHSLLNAVDETGQRCIHHPEPAIAAVHRNRQAERGGIQSAANGGYDFVNRRATICRRSGGVQLGLLRFEPGLPALLTRHLVRDETQ